MQIAVVGAGIAGLGAAITLAHDGHDVVVLERDATPLPETPEAAFGWNRRGAPQVRHSHAFLARGRNLLRDRLPEVRTALLDAGAGEVGWADMIPDTIEDKSPQPGDEDIVMLACRRTTFEWTLRTVALATERVEFRDGVTVEGLCTTQTDGIPHVRGLRTAAGDIPADVVVDGSGRPSRLLLMLADVGVTVDETKSDTGIVYLSRFYRLRDGVTEPARQPFNGADLDYLKFAVFRGDNRTFSVTLAYPPDDEDLQRLREPGNFDTAISLIDIIRPWVDPDVGEPISGVHYMGGLINRVRRFVVDGTPRVLGLHAVGDSGVCTNPLYGQGCSLALYHSVLFARTLAEHGDDPIPLATSFHEVTERKIVPWYDGVVRQDEINRKIAHGEPLSDFDAFMRSLIIEGLFPASRTSATVSRAWARTFNLLVPMETTFSEPEVMREIMAAYEERETREPEPPRGPTKQALLAAIEAA